MDDNLSDLASAWHGVVADLQPNQRAWLRASEPITLHGHTAIIAVPNDFTRHQLEGRLRAQLEDALSVRFGEEIRIAVTVNPALDDTESQSDMSTYSPVDSTIGSDEAPAPLAAAPAPADLGPVPPAPRREMTPSTPEPAAPVDSGVRPNALETRLNPKYTFETFVIGSSNRFPHAAAVAVAEAPGKAYNPLLVYGDSGLGKTHLLHAIGHYVRSLFSGARVRYVSSEEFTSSSSTRSATTRRPCSSAATATWTCC